MGRRTEGADVKVFDRLRILELATEIAGPYCTKLFADLGADVIKVESPEGDPLRRRSTVGGGQDDAPLFKFLNAGKRSVIATSPDQLPLETLEGADLLVESLGPGVLDHEDLLRRYPWLVIVTLSPYGYSGPYRDRPATEFTVQAESGSMATRGLADQPPIQAGGRLFEWLLGTYAAVGASGALLRAEATGDGELIDCSLMEACDVGGSVYAELTYELMGRPPLATVARRVELPSIEPTADGWVGFNTNTRQQFESFLSMIGRSDLLDEDESWALVGTRHDRASEWNQLVRSWTTQHTTGEIVEQATLLRIPVAPVNNGQTVLEHPRIRRTGSLGERPRRHVRASLAAIPYRWRTTAASGQGAKARRTPGEDRAPISSRVHGRSVFAGASARGRPGARCDRVVGGPGIDPRPRSPWRGSDPHRVRSAP